AQFNYAADRYGLQLDRLVVPQNFNPEVGFLPRTNFRRNFVSGRFSPRPANNKTIRKFYFDSSFNYTTDNDNRLESRQAMGAFASSCRTATRSTSSTCASTSFCAGRSR